MLQNMLKNMVTTLLPFLFASHVASATTQNFRVHAYQQLTPQVDRLFGTGHLAFANIFCANDAAEIFFVDARYPEFDGVSFQFPSLQTCNESRAKIRANYRKCKTEVKLGTEQKSAELVLSNCK